MELPPAAPKVALLLPRVTEQMAPAWFTVTVWPAIVAVSVRLAVVPFAGIVIVVLPLPVPAAGAAPRLVAVQEHVESEASI